MCTFYAKYLGGKNNDIIFASYLHNERVDN